MAYIPAAEASPRIENGILYWYNKDTFQLDLRLDVRDQDGETVTIDTEEDTITVVFYDKRHDVVKTFAFGAEGEGEIGADGTVVLEFDAETSGLFRRGRFAYDVFLTHGGERRTMADKNPLEVE